MKTVLLIIGVFYFISIISVIFMFKNAKQISKDSDLMDEDEKLEFSRIYARDLDNKK